MKRIAYAMPMALLLSLCLACNNAKNPSTTKAASPEMEKTGAVSNELVAADTSVAVAGNAYEQDQTLTKDKEQIGKKPPAPPVANPDWDKKIIKTAEINLEVKSFAVFTQRLHQAVKLTGGYIAQEEQSQSAGEVTNTVTIKVPVANFDDLLLHLPGDSDRLVDKKISSQDVTMEVIDTKSLLETKKEVRERYLELLRQAHSMKDILAVQNEINDIQQEMDQATGRISYLGHSAAYSTINVKFYQVLTPDVVVNPSPSFFQKLKESLGDGWEGLSAFLIGLLRAWPMLIFVAVIAYWIRKTALRATRAKLALAQPQEENK